MKIRALKAVVFLVFFFGCFLSAAYPQELLLRHKLVPGRVGKAQTVIEMQGDSFIADQKAATNLTIRMLQEFRVGAVDAAGNAALQIQTQRLTTQGKMNDAAFNEDLMGDKLNSVMFGAAKMDAEVSPLGQVRGKSETPLSQLGITLPTGPADSGGFEFPTFPVEPVRVGDYWTESGMLLRTQGVNPRNAVGEKVYQLKGISNSAYGRTAIIRYRKVTDLSGMGLGNPANPGGALGNFGGASQVNGLVIDLEGEIEFMIDQGVVLRSDQQGFWNLQMDTFSTAQKNRTAVKQQGMRIRIQIRFQWNPINTQIQRSASPAEPPAVPLLPPDPVLIKPELP